ncbi:HAD-like protein [Stereum hirsutum FP-91666 SS1]|uniref:HAD-like protein n=1 Tax=Stereum hirsutum (strain FP-91666) TaxID=721885 RepID=UPI000440D259|nr:HAD-like protein [Stereum hirsutum FP-91666 SS1]EIM90196.1 HAD-like protein [Stereum hirsutum FP-91666 SS1]
MENVNLNTAIKAVIFDIGGVVLKSPLIAIGQYEKEHGIPDNYINCSITARAPHGAWQKFERGEMPLFPFYEAFGTDLSDTINGNKWYMAYCRRRSIDCPTLPKSLNIDGRELFGKMMRESTTYDECVLEAIRRIRETGKYRIIALTNNFSKTDTSILGDHPPPGKYGGIKVTLESELKFLGWTNGAVPPGLRALFDDFVDSSEIGMRKPETRFYAYCLERNKIAAHEAVFLDDLGQNLKAAKDMGMKTIHVPIGGSLNAIKELEQVLDLDLTNGFDPSRQSTSKL